jgi:predicted nucleic acid-binding protein
MTERFYWDACVFLSYINAVPDRVAVVEDFLSRSRLGKIEIVTSTLSLVEVAFGAIEKSTNTLDPAIEAKIDSLWRDRKAVKLAEVHELLERDARGLIRFALQNGWSLKPPDAIHLATAKNLGVAQIHTYEKTKWKKYEPAVGIEICEPEGVQGVLTPIPKAPLPPTKSEPETK